MAGASAVRCCSSVPSFRSFSRSRGGRESGWARQLFLLSSSSPRLISPLRGGHPGFRVGCCSANPDDAGVFGGDDAYGFYPWDPRNSSGGGDAIQWMPEEQITLFTTDGLIQIGGSLVPRRVSSSDRKQPKSKTPQKFQRFQESDYMDPNQGLCLGALFDIAATNGLDTGRRLCIFGFCRSIEMLSNVVEDAVLGHGGEVVAAEKASKGGLQEKLTMIVAVPLLWGVPPASETLHVAVRSGGGIVEKVYWQWDFL